MSTACTSGASWREKCPRKTPIVPASARGSTRAKASAGPAGREQVQALVALIHEPGWAHAALVPDPRGPSFLPDAGFVLAPDLETLVRMLSRDSLKPRGELLF